MKRKKTRRPLGARRRKPANRTLTREELMVLAAEPVPIGSGYAEYGSGPHVYLKGCIWDGSTRCFRFRSLDDATAAMAIGVANDSFDLPWEDVG